MIFAKSLAVPSNACTKTLMLAIPEPMPILPRPLIDGTCAVVVTSGFDAQGSWAWLNHEVLRVVPLLGLVRE